MLVCNEANKQNFNHSPIATNKFVMSQEAAYFKLLHNVVAPQLDDVLSFDVSILLTDTVAPQLDDVPHLTSASF